MNSMKLVENVEVSLLKKKCSIYRLCTAVNGHRFHIDVQAEESKFQTSAPCDQNEDISVFSVSSS